MVEAHLHLSGWAQGAALGLLALLPLGCEPEPGLLGGAGGDAGASSLVEAGGAFSEQTGGNAGAGGLAGAAGAFARPADFPDCGSSPSIFATASPGHSFGPGQDVGQDEFPEPLLGPPLGGGTAGGSVDVVSLGESGSVTLEFADNYIIDESGPDFLVFENPFLIGGDPENPYAELGEVAVSQDGDAWLTFPCERRSYPYGSCAGWHPVLAGDEEIAGGHPDAEDWGGDPFDLADVGLAWARYVRVTDVDDGSAKVFDLDALAIIHPGCY